MAFAALNNTIRVLVPYCLLKLPRAHCVDGPLVLAQRVILKLTFEDFRKWVSAGMSSTQNDTVQ